MLNIAMLNMLQVLNIKKVSFYTERDIVISTLDIENFLIRHINSNQISKLDIELLVNFLIGYSSVKLGTLTNAVQTVFFKIYQMFGIQVSTILVNSICVRNLFHQITTPVEIGEQVEDFGIQALRIDEYNDEKLKSLQASKEQLLVEKSRQNIVTDRLEIFKSMF